MLDWLLGRKVKIVAIIEGEGPGGGVLPYKGLMGTCGQPGYVFRDFYFYLFLFFYFYFDLFLVTYL